MTTGKTIALTRRTFVGKVMSVLFNKLSRLVIALLSRNKCLLIPHDSKYLLIYVIVFFSTVIIGLVQLLK